MEVKSVKYNLSGKYLVTKEEGVFYRFTTRKTTPGDYGMVSIYVPERDIDYEVEGFDPTQVKNSSVLRGVTRRSRKGRKSRKGTRRA